MDLVKFLQYLYHLDKDPVELKLRSVEGSELSGGRSFNYWGRVPTRNLPLEMLREDWGEGKRSCIWTAYDDLIYDPTISDETFADECRKVRFINHAHTNARKATPEGLERLNQILGDLDPNHIIPSEISGTFKSCTSRYTCVMENLGMKIALALGMPTSFNYIARFDKSKHPEIVRNYQTPGFDKKVLPFGLVSIDMLKNDERLEEFRDYGIDQNEGRLDVLLPHLEKIVRKHTADLPQEEQDHQVKKAKSRMVRSFLLREYLGDVDFTAKNCGIVVGTEKGKDGKEKKVVRFAPNYDYGEICRSIVGNKLEGKLVTEESLTESERKTMELLKKFQPGHDYIATRNAAFNKPVSEYAHEFAVDGVSQANIKYIMENFPEDVEEFYSKLHRLSSAKIPRNILREYCAIKDEECGSLLKPEEAEMLTEYLDQRVEFMYDQLPEKFARLRPNIPY